MDKRLKQFLAVAETGNVTAAARRLNISQPSISVSIRKLEEQHGVPLFERSSRGVVLTGYGAILHEHARVMARLEEHAGTRIRELKSSGRPALKIGCGFAWWSAFVGSVVADYRADHPDASVHVDVASSLDGLRNLLSGDIDLFIGTRVDRLRPGLGLTFDELFVVRDGSFVREGHPLIGKRVSRARLAACDTLDVVPFESGHLGIVEVGPTGDVGLVRSGAKGVVLSTSSMSVCLDLLRASDAVLTYPVVAEAFFRARGVVMLDVSASRPRLPIGIYSLAERARDERLIDMKRRVAAASARAVDP